MGHYRARLDRLQKSEIRNSVNPQNPQNPDKGSFASFAGTLKGENLEFLERSPASQEVASAQRNADILATLLDDHPLPGGSYQPPAPGLSFAAFLVGVGERLYRMEPGQPQPAATVRQWLRNQHPNKNVLVIPLVKEESDGGRVWEVGFAPGSERLKPCPRCDSPHFWHDGETWHCSECNPRPAYLAGVAGTTSVVVHGGKKAKRNGDISGFPTHIQALLKAAATAQQWDKDTKLDIATSIHENPKYSFWETYLKEQAGQEQAAENSDIRYSPCPQNPQNLPQPGFAGFAASLNSENAENGAAPAPAFALESQAEKPKAGAPAKALLEQSGYALHLVNDPALVGDAVAALLASSNPLGVDIETSRRPGCTHRKAGLDPHLSSIRLMQFANENTVFVFDLAAINPEPLRPLFDKPLVAHNAIFELKHCLLAGFDPKVLHCTLLMARVRYGERLSLADVAKKVLKWEIDKSLQVSDWGGLLTEAQLAYAALDAVAVKLLYPKLKAALQERNQLDAYRLLGAAQRPVAKMELAGCPFDTEGHRALIREWQESAEKAAEELTAVMGQVNFNSGAQIAAWLEKTLDPETLNAWPRTGSGVLATGKDTLALYAHLPLVKPLVAYKDATKRLSTYGLSWTEHINSVTGRIHADFLIAESAPGRFSCRNPNLQQLPRDERFRALVKASSPEYRLIVADYSQIELRTVALLSQDPAMLAAYEQGEDLHRKTAAAVLGIEPAQVTKAQRQMAKAINFGLIYGMSAATLVNHSKINYGVDMTMQEAEKAHRAFFATYPRLRYWQTLTANETKHTLKSRIAGSLIRQYNPENYSYTEALNTPVQGAAAMAMLAALPKVEAGLKGLDARMINLVHDEVILEVANKDVAAAKQALVQGMTEGFLQIFPNACTRDLVEAHDGNTWQEAK